MFDYSSLLLTASSLLNQFGSTWTLKRINKFNYDPTTNTRVQIPDSEYTVKAVRQNYRDSQIDGQMIQKGDILLLVDSNGLNIIPSISDKLIKDSISWNIIDVKKLSPADINLLYIIQIRK